MKIFYLILIECIGNYVTNIIFLLSIFSKISRFFVTITSNINFFYRVSNFKVKFIKIYES